MATHFIILAWRIPWTEELGRQQSAGSHRAGHDWETYTSSVRLLLHAFWIIYKSKVLLNQLFSELLLPICNGHSYFLGRQSPIALESTIKSDLDPVWDLKDDRFDLFLKRWHFCLSLSKPFQTRFPLIFACIWHIEMMGECVWTSHSKVINRRTAGPEERLWPLGGGTFNSYYLEKLQLFLWCHMGLGFKLCGVTTEWSWM